ncbi:MAG TPA: tripartite tricarboxylate transporter substrate binding protein [Bordetella sp.]|jgi:tripartite-type tricarboxylate transporter receptor subunit TctC|nr:tripartite tricarboxylate transporter substrate binding protein [Bordetella sp.]
MQHSQSRRRLLTAAATATAASWLPRAALAQTSALPDKTLRLIVPFAPGGPVDSLGRLLGKIMSPGLKQPVVVDNRPGGGGVVALNAVSSAPADGATMVLASITLVTTPAMMHVSYDAEKDFEPLTVAAFIPHILVVRADYPAKTLAELVAAAKANPNSMSYGSSGNGTSAHLAGALFADRAGLQVTHVPYRGAAPALTDLLAGRLQFMFLDTPTLLPYLRAGKLRALAAAPAAGAKALPDVPTIAASGYPGFDIHAWYGALIKAGTPEPTRQALYGALRDALRSDEARQYLSSVGIDPGGMPPEQFASLIHGDLAQWKDTIGRLHISIG